MHRRIRVVCGRFAVPGLLLLALAAPAHAEIGTLDNVPGATLLLPHFEVDTVNPNGQTTLLSIINTGQTAQLAHVTLWSLNGVPVTAFDVYFTGFDMQPLNLRDVIVNGQLPRTATDGQDPADDISPQGALSQDVNLASCTGLLPPAPLSAAQIDDLKAALTGHPVAGFGGKCASDDAGDAIARGYLTVDLVSACTASMLPTNPAYPQLLIPNNALAGEFTLVNPTQNLAQGDLMVSIEASVTDPRTTTNGAYTFYGALYGANASDHREPLGTTWVSPYFNKSNARTQIWRDPKRVLAPYTCGTAGGARLPVPGLVATTMKAATASPSVASNLFDRVAGEAYQDPSGIVPPSKEGYFSWDPDYGGSGLPYGNVAQSYVFTISGSHEGAEGRYSMGVPAVQTGSAAAPPARPASTVTAAQEGR